MTHLPLPEIPGISADTIEAVASQAESDADLVLAFLNEIGIHPTPDCPVGLPPGFLLDLGAALRLLEWERVGVRSHLQDGLPPARRALTEAFRFHQERPDRGPSLSQRVMVLFVERFAWHGRRDWNAAIVLDSLDDDAALDAVAEFLFKYRHIGLPAFTTARHP
jgi:hypothetical protein